MSNIQPLGAPQVRHQGTKTVLAAHMTLGEYNALRGWAIPANESPDKRGYLVEYEDGGEPNHIAFAGYISWSPADVFERNYKCIASFKDRVQLEYNELKDKLIKLQTFIGSDAYNGLPSGERARLLHQRDSMHAYAQALELRMAADFQ